MRTGKDKYTNLDVIIFKPWKRKKRTSIFDTLNELIWRVLSKEAIPWGFSSTKYIFQSGVGVVSNCGFSHRRSCPRGQERSPKSAPQHGVPRSNDSAIKFIACCN